MKGMQELKAQTREIKGKTVKTLRQSGFLPAVVYGEKVASQPITVSFRDFEHVYREAGESSVVTLELNGASHNVLIHDVAFDPIRGIPVHADFYAVEMDKPLRTMIPLVFTGESPAVKNFGGILIKVVQELEVEATPRDLPHELFVDLETLAELEARILVKDISVPKGAKIMADPEEVVALAEPPKSEEALKAELEQGVAEVAQVETEQEAKRAEKAKAEEEGAEAKSEK